MSMVAEAIADNSIIAKGFGHANCRAFILSSVSLHNDHFAQRSWQGKSKSSKRRFAETDHRLLLQHEEGAGNSVRAKPI
jgi:hypothetical protein